MEHGGPFTYTYTYRWGKSFWKYDFGDPFDIFESFLVGEILLEERVVRQIPRYSITIDFMEAVKGVRKEVNIEGKKRKIKIPAGIYEGARIILVILLFL